MTIKYCTGQSLIEIVVAVGIIATVLVGVSSLITKSLSLSTFQSNKSRAVNAAQNQINHYAKVRDLSPSAFFGNYNDYTTCVEVPEQIASCQITYERLPSDTSQEITGVKIHVTVSWKEGDDTLSTELSQILAKPTK